MERERERNSYVSPLSGLWRQPYRLFSRFVTHRFIGKTCKLPRQLLAAQVVYLSESDTQVVVGGRGDL